MNIKLKKSEILEDCIQWEACEEGIRWLKGLADEVITLKIAMKKNPKWTAWYLYLAGCYWKNERYTPAIAKALIQTGEMKYIYLARYRWKSTKKKHLK